MFSLLFVALFAILSLSVSSLPLSSSYSPTITDDCSSPTPSFVQTTDDCSPTPSFVQTTDDCSTLTPTTTTTTTPTPTPTPTPTSVSSATSSSSVSPPTSTAATAVSDASGGPYYGGVATYFYQNGNPGACGQYNSDYAMICAMDQARFGTNGPASSLCGQQVQITNLNNGLSIVVTIVDDCPTCQNENSIDLSVGAFEALDSNLSDGEFPISWSYV